MASSQLQGIIDGIAATLRAVTALKNVITYKPDQPGPLPMVYLSGIHLDYPETTYGEMTIGWNLEWYLVLGPIAAKAEAAELSLYGLVPDIVAALGHDLDAGGSLSLDEGTSDGQMLLTDADEGEVVIGGTKWYALRLRIRAIERFTFEYRL